VDKLDIKIASAYLVLKLAEAEDPVQAQGPVSEIGKWWENYNKPFLDSWKQTRGDPKTDTKGDIVGAASSLYGKRPGTLLGLLGMLIGGTMGPKWAAGLGALGLGGGYLWGQRNNPAIGNWIKAQMQPTIKEVEDRVDKRMAPALEQSSYWKKFTTDNPGAVKILNFAGGFVPNQKPAAVPAPVVEPKPVAIAGT
jgi:hypothetical protein